MENLLFLGVPILKHITVNWRSGNRIPNPGIQRLLHANTLMHVYKHINAYKHALKCTHSYTRKNSKTDKCYPLVYWHGHFFYEADLVGGDLNPLPVKTRWWPLPSGLLHVSLRKELFVDQSLKYFKIKCFQKETDNFYKYLRLRLDNRQINIVHVESSHSSQSICTLIRQ